MEDQKRVKHRNRLNKRRAFSRKFKRLVGVIRAKWSCARNSHEWELRSVKLTMNGASFATTTAWTCKNCGLVDLDQKLEDDPNV